MHKLYYYNGNTFLIFIVVKAFTTRAASIFTSNAVTDDLSFGHGAFLEKTGHFLI
jgi:hypothetical protein